MIKVHLTLRIQNTEALRANCPEGDVVPWKAALNFEVPPRRNEWVWIPGARIDSRRRVHHGPICKARAGTPEHVPTAYNMDHDIRFHYHVPLLLGHLSEDDAQAIGVAWEPWMTGLAPRALTKAKQAAAQDREKVAAALAAKGTQGKEAP
jgi:hypothetical protein